MSLCAVCSNIDPRFFSLIGQSNYELQVTLCPINRMSDGAASGCPMCACLSASFNVGHLPKDVLETIPAVLVRAFRSSEGDFVMTVGQNVVSRTEFSYIPIERWPSPRAVFGHISPDLFTMSKWIDECINSHPKCYAQNETFTPTPLIDVMAFNESKDVRLVILDTDNLIHNNNSTLPRKYVALSHCWGPPSKRPLTTTRRTLAQHIQHISFSELPLSFKDAVRLTASLGQRYLWIDSLCIVQDDPEDWKHEASKMSQVYGNAIVTLSGLSSADGTQGCRVVNAQAAIPGHRLFDLDIGPQRIRIFEGGFADWHEEYGDSKYSERDSKRNPLRGRAWVLQERELSVRTIHFSHHMILWECKTCQRTDELPWGHEQSPLDAQFSLGLHPQPNYRGRRIIGQRGKDFTRPVVRIDG